MRIFTAILLLMAPTIGAAQVAPSATEVAAYRGLHLAAHEGDVEAIQRLAPEAEMEARDGRGRSIGIEL